MKRRVSALEGSNKSATITSRVVFVTINQDVGIVVLRVVVLWLWVGLMPLRVIVWRLWLPLIVPPLNVAVLLWLKRVSVA